MTAYKLISMLVPVDDGHDEAVEAAIPSGTLCYTVIVEREAFRGVDEMKQIGLQHMTAFARALDQGDESP